MTLSIPILYFSPGPMEMIIIGLICLMTFVLPVVILIVVLTTGKRSSSTKVGGERVQCPQCAEWIMLQALKCRFCGADLIKKDK